MDAFNQDWKALQGRGYANPPWNLVGRVLNSVQQQQVTLVLIAPVWKSQPWYPKLLEMVVDFPILLPPRTDLILPTHPEYVPEVMPQLAAWLISGDGTRTKKFQKRAQSCSSLPGGRNPPNPTTHSFTSGWSGAVHGMRIPFQDP